MPATAGSAGGREAPDFRDVSVWADWTRRLLYLQAALSLASTLSIMVLPGASVGGSAPPPPLVALIWFIQSMVWIANAVTVLRWIYVANANARALGADNMDTEPGMAVAWFFIPIANLFMPFKAMRETWQASACPEDWESASPAALIGWWWLFWILSNAAVAVGWAIGGEARDRATLPGADVSGLIEVVDTAMALSDILTIPAALLLAAIIARVQELQLSAGPGGDRLTNGARTGISH